MSKEELSEREVHDLVEVIGVFDPRCADAYTQYLTRKALNILNPDWKEIHEKLGMPRS